MSAVRAQKGEDFVRELVLARKVVLFGRLGCPFTMRMKDVLARLHLGEGDCEVVELSDREDEEEILEHFRRAHGLPLVPCLYLKGKYAGGYAELMSEPQDDRRLLSAIQAALSS